MLLRQATLRSIVAGEVSCAFRRWRRPTVRTGGTLQTSVGVLRIDSVAKVSLSSITMKDARRAGYATKEDLVAELAARENEDLFRIDLHFEGADPRIALREKSNLAATEIETLRLKLARFDASSAHGPWTARVLEAIRTHPKERAGDLALSLGFPKDWLKVSVRKLKNLGLTISHEPGYELSPRGERLVQSLRNSPRNVI